MLQDKPSQETGGGTPSVPEGEAIPKELDLLAGMASDDTDYRKVRVREGVRVYVGMTSDRPTLKALKAVIFEENVLVLPDTRYA